LILGPIFSCNGVSPAWFFSTLPVVAGPVEIAAMLPGAAAKCTKRRGIGRGDARFSVLQGYTGDDPIFLLPPRRAPWG
jgi:hypothetical protein